MGKKLANLLGVLSLVVGITACGPIIKDVGDTYHFDIKTDSYQKVLLKTDKEVVMLSQDELIPQSFLIDLETKRIKKIFNSREDAKSYAQNIKDAIAAKKSEEVRIKNEKIKRQFASTRGVSSFKGTAVKVNPESYVMTNRVVSPDPKLVIWTNEVNPPIGTRLSFRIKCTNEFGESSFPSQKLVGVVSSENDARFNNKNISASSARQENSGIVFIKAGQYNNCVLNEVRWVAPPMG